MDGVVNRTDLAALVANLGDSNMALWSEGNFDLDNAVTIRDLQILQAHVTAGGQSPSLAPSAVPEPASWLMALAALILGASGRLYAGRAR
jgi:hypothetical protein